MNRAFLTIPCLCFNYIQTSLRVNVSACNVGENHAIIITLWSTEFKLSARGTPEMVCYLYGIGVLRLPYLISHYLTVVGTLFLGLLREFEKYSIFDNEEV